MANTKSAIRAIRVSGRKRARRKPVVSELKTHVRNAERMMFEEDEDAEGAVKAAIVALDKSASKGIIHRNNAARRKSRLMRKLNDTMEGSRGE